jgi:chromosome partition protein MukB
MIEFRRKDDMMGLLETMQDQEQWRLFQDEENLSLAEAMEKVYRRITGGQVHGQELLDYRKYIQLTVKVKRKSETKWEKGSVLSTGEAIGTGASILMVILGAWEDQYSWLKDRDLKDSMRFLFMDEATRLDPKSIHTLLDFCKQMNVQLLIAGPRFEGKECGSGITYRVVRKNFLGGEQVVIRGRKGFGGDFEDRDEAA